MGLAGGAMMKLMEAGGGGWRGRRQYCPQMGGSGEKVVLLTENDWKNRKTKVTTATGIPQLL